MRKRSPIIVLPLFLEIFNINPLFLLIVSSAAQGSSNIYLDNAANGWRMWQNTLLCFLEGHTIVTHCCAFLKGTPLLHIVVLFGRAHHSYIVTHCYHCEPAQM